MEVLIGNVDYRQTGFNEAFLEHLAFSIIGGSNRYYESVQSLLKTAAPSKASLLSHEDFTLNEPEQNVLKGELLRLLNELLLQKEIEPLGAPGTQTILNRNVRFSLREPEDKLIAILLKLLAIVEDCLVSHKPVFFSVVTDPYKARV